MNPDATSDEDDGEFADPGAGDAIELLSADHDELRLMFADYEDLVSDAAGADERLQLARQICTALLAHSTAEEEIFYPAARELIDQPELIDEAEAEHDGAKALIVQIQRMEPSHAHYDATVMKLHAAVEQHVQEEEDALFALVQDSRIDLQLLGERIAQRKSEVLAELEQAD